MLLLQAALCFSANGLAALLAVLLLRDARDVLAARLGAAVFLCSIGYSLTLLPVPLRLPSGLYEVAVLVNVPTLGLNLLFGRALLLDDFQMDWKAWCLFAGTSVLMLLGALDLLGVELLWSGQVSLLLAFAGLAVMAHVLWIAVSGFRGDLVDNRRRLRIGLVIFVIATYSVVSVIELRGMSIVAEGIAFDTSTLIISTIFLFWLIRTEPARVFAVPSRTEVTAEPASAPKTNAAKLKLLSVMEEDEAWREDDLSIGRLADLVGVPEHRLRVLINGEMGYRNFPSFLNGYRLNAAKQILSDPDQEDLPILTIAMDAGYRSLSTFNRAFKAQEGETPSSFRARSLSSEQTTS